MRARSASGDEIRPVGLRPPGRPRRFVRAGDRCCGDRVVGAGAPIDDDLERTVETGGGASPADPRHDLREDVRTCPRLAVWPQGLHHEPIPADRPAHRPLVWPRAHNPDRDPRPLHGRRAERHRSEPVVIALERERLAGLQAIDDCQGLVEQAGPRPGCHGFAHVAEARIVERAEADRHDQAPVREVVERDDLARELPRPPARRREDQCPEPDPLGPGGHRGQQDPRVPHVPVADGDRVVGEDPVPAGCLGLGGEVGGGLRIAGGDDDAVLHGRIIPCPEPRSQPGRARDIHATRGTPTPAPPVRLGRPLRVGARRGTFPRTVPRRDPKAAPP